MVVPRYIINPKPDPQKTIPITMQKKNNYLKENETKSTKLTPREQT